MQIDREALKAACETATIAACAAIDPLRSIDRITEKAITAYLTATTVGGDEVPVGWTAPAQLELVVLGISGVIRKNADEYCTVPLYAAPPPPSQEGSREVKQWRYTEGPFVEFWRDGEPHHQLAAPIERRTLYTTPAAPDEAVEAERERIISQIARGVEVRQPDGTTAIRAMDEDEIVAMIRSRSAGGAA
ncbi:hypothetical protein [Labrys neptuniae]